MYAFDKPQVVLPLYYSYSDYHFILELIAAVIFCTYIP